MADLRTIERVVQNTAFASQAESLKAMDDNLTVYNHNCKYATAVLSVDSGSGNAVTAIIEGFDPASQKWYALLSGAAVIAGGQAVLQVGPALPATANVSANAPLPKHVRVRPSHSGAAKYSLSLTLSP
jgi:hypothetical protein